MAIESLGSIVKRGAAGVFIVNVCGVGVAFLAQIILARVMGIEHFGVYAYVTSWLAILLVFAKCGVDRSVLRFVAAYESRQEWGAIRGIVIGSNWFVLGVSATLAAAGVIFVLALGDRIESDLRIALVIGLSVLPVLALSRLREVVLQALRHVVLAGLPESILRPLLLAVLVLVAYAGLGIEVTGAVAMALYLASAVLVFIFGVALLRHFMPLEVRATRSEYRMREWLGVALPLLFVGGVSIVSRRTDIVMLGVLVDTDVAGVYAVSGRIADLVLFGVAATSAVISPMTSRLFASDDRAGMQHVISLAIRMSLLVALPVFVVVMVWSDFALGLFGDGFSSGVTALRILAVAQLMLVFLGPANQFLVMTGQHNKVAIIFAIAAVTNITLNAILIPLYGMEGAAAATAFSAIVARFAMAVVSYRNAGVLMLPFGRARQIPAAPGHASPSGLRTGE